jgi:hypothetical protein
MLNYYSISIKESKKNYWFLSKLKNSNGEIIDEMQFQRCLKLNIENDLFYQVEIDGERPLFFFAGANTAPVIGVVIKQEFDKLMMDSVQYIPVGVHGYDEKYYILNIIKDYDCMDKDKSKYDLFSLPNIPTPMMMMYDLYIRQNDEYPPIFRIKDYGTAVIISQKIKDILEKYKVDGINYKLV